MTEGQDWDQIGAIGVDAGVVWLGDPCYTMTPDTPFAIASTWDDFVLRLFERKRNRVARWTRPEGWDVGVAVESGDGDGVYPVYVTGCSLRQDRRTPRLLRVARLTDDRASNAATRGHLPGPPTELA